jgi:UDP-N-acetylglucosamine--N-acetylmuramyl-(pentapeptide) pyrophosphoryl-undecaprenol N-acetylglucosamine transferase
MNTPIRHILFVGGGTAGHTAPVVAVARSCMAQAHLEGQGHGQAEGLRMSYIGLRQDLSSPMIAQSGLPWKTYAITAGKINRFLTVRHFSEGIKGLIGLIQALWIILRIRPTAVFAKGGFVSIPVVLAARIARIPIITHETDVVAGLANRIVARFARTICTAFPSKAYPNFPKEKLLYTGQPIREAFSEIKATSPIEKLLGRALPKDKPHILVIGGSQGARKINELLSQVWADILPKAVVIHITGQPDAISMVRRAELLPPTLQRNLWLAPYISTELPDLMRSATLVISRSGGTIFELAAVKAPSILIPLSTSAGDHQAKNARVLERIGAAVVFDERTVTLALLRDEILHLLKTVADRDRLSAQIARFHKGDAAQRIAQELLSL